LDSQYNITFVTDPEKTRNGSVMRKNADRRRKENRSRDEKLSIGDERKEE
jgi:hypothetical protein